MSTARNKGKHYQPVLCTIKLFPHSGKSVIVDPFECTDHSGLVLPFKNRTVLLQGPMASGRLTQPLNPETLSIEMKEVLMLAPFVIAWVQNWLIVKLAEEGRAVEVMTPPTPVAGAQV